MGKPIEFEAIELLREHDNAAIYWKDFVDDIRFRMPAAAAQDLGYAALHGVRYAIRKMDFTQAYTADDSWQRFPLENHGNNLVKVARAMIANPEPPRRPRLRIVK